MSLFGCQPDSSIEEYQNLSVTLSVTLSLTLPLYPSRYHFSRMMIGVGKYTNCFGRNPAMLQTKCWYRMSANADCWVRLTNAKRPNQQIRISDQIWLKLKRWLAIIIFMSKLLMKSTSWRSGNVTDKVVTWRIKW